MGKIFTASAATLALIGTTLAAAAPADAQRWRGGYYGGYHGHYHGNRTGVAIGAGILGLAAGAAIASSARGGYYGGPAYYDYGPGYYAPPPPPVYYAPRYCRSDWRWDGWAGRYVRVRYCD